MDKRLSIYVSSPDSYSDVLAVFLKGYRRYWSDCPYEFILTTNTKSYEGITCICNNKQNDTWVERTIAALPVIKSKYVMLMCDDIILSDNVDNSLIERLLDYMDSHEIRYCNLGPTPKGSKIKSFPLLRSVNKQIPYAINLQFGIFRKDLFVELLGDGSLSAWDIENSINEQAAVAPSEDYKDVVAVSEYILPYIHGVYYGNKDSFQSIKGTENKTFIRDISVTGGHEPLLMMLTNHHLICREYNDSVSLKGYNKLLKVNDTLFYALPEFGLVKYVVNKDGIRERGRFFHDIRFTPKAS